MGAGIAGDCHLAACATGRYAAIMSHHPARPSVSIGARHDRCFRRAHAVSRHSR
jgi:hypothetical protein